MSAAVKCSACNDTGSLPGSHDLDCASCGAAVERIEAQQSFYSNEMRNMDTDDRFWAIYQLGKAAGAAENYLDASTVDAVRKDNRRLYDLLESQRNAFMEEIVKAHENRWAAEDVHRKLSQLYHEVCDYAKKLESSTPPKAP